MPKKELYVYTQPYESALQAYVLELGAQALGASPAGTESAMKIANQAIEEWRGSTANFEFYHSMLLALGLAELRHTGPEDLYLRACRLVGWKRGLAKGELGGKNAARVEQGKLLSDLDPPPPPFRSVVMIDPENERAILEGEWEIWPSYEAVRWEE